MSNKLTKPELFELVLKTQVNTTNRIDSLVKETRDLKQCYKRVECTLQFPEMSTADSLSR